jgi:hypothetical protein
LFSFFSLSLSFASGIKTWIFFQLKVQYSIDLLFLCNFCLFYLLFFKVKFLEGVLHLLSPLYYLLFIPNYLQYGLTPNPFGGNQTFGGYQIQLTFSHFYLDSLLLVLKIHTFFLKFLFYWLLCWDSLLNVFLAFCHHFWDWLSKYLYSSMLFLDTCW